MKHRIHEQIIELQAHDEALARSLLDRVSALQRRELVAILDRVLSEVSPDADRVHRIERLELDLGSIDPNDFEGGFRRAFEAALRRAIGRAIADAATDDATKGGGRPRTGPLELVEVFTTTGALPWWADARQRDAVIEAVAALVRASSPELRRLLVGLGAARPETLARLIQALDEPTRVALLDGLIPGAGRQLEQLIAARPGRAQPRPDAIARCELWTAALVSAALALGQRTSRGHRERFLVELLERAPERVPTWTRAELARELAQQAEQPAPLQPSPTTPAPSDTLARLVSLVDEAPASKDAAALAALETLEAQPTTSLDAAALARALAWLDTPGADALTPTLREALRSSLRAALVGASATAPTREPTREHELDAGQPPAATHERGPRSPSERAADALPSTPDPRRPQTSRPTPPKRPPTIQTLDAIPVDNAGLVLLWPFIPHLLRRCELLVDDAFVDLRAQTQAVALLERCAVGGSTSLFAEHQVALDKVLCGLTPDDVLAPLDPDEPIPPAWLAEADRMLEAVVLHAEILRDMPIDTLRATFLRREGLLRVRDGAWLLQVEAQSHDIVLERFAWGFSWVKLPWMLEPICVEW